MSAENKDFEALFDSFVISLRRTPDRLKVFQEYNSGAGIRFESVDAVEGNKIRDSNVARYFSPGAKPYSSSSLGNALSHLGLWQRCVAQAKNFIILEDDAIVRRDIKEKLPNLVEGIDKWDIVLLGYNTDVPLELNISPDMFSGTLFSAPYPSHAQLSRFVNSTYPVGLHSLKLALGTCGYVISPKGADVLARTCFPLDRRLVQFGAVKHSFRAAALDAVMATVYPMISAYACLAPLVMTPNNKANSTVET